MQLSARELAVKLAVYGFFAAEAKRPTVADIGERVELSKAEVLAAFRSLRSQRVLVLEQDGESIRMASPFSGVPTQHVAEVDGRSYDANCAWDLLGVIAALRRPGVAHSRCERSRETLRLSVDKDGPEASEWLFHCHVPAARWWDDIVFT